MERKRDRTPTEVTAQALDYASWVVSLSNERVTAIAADHLDHGLDAVFSSKFARGCLVPRQLPVTK